MIVILLNTLVHYSTVFVIVCVTDEERESESARASKRVRESERASKSERARKSEFARERGSVQCLGGRHRHSHDCFQRAAY